MCCSLLGCSYSQLNLFLFLFRLKTEPLHRYFDFLFYTIELILVFSLFVFVLPHSNNEERDSQYPRNIYLFNQTPLSGSDTEPCVTPKLLLVELPVRPLLGSILLLWAPSPLPSMEGPQLCTLALSPLLLGPHLGSWPRGRTQDSLKKRFGNN